MQALIQTIATKTGITEAQAQTAITETLALLKSKLPTSVGNQLEGLMTGAEFDYKAVATEKLHELKDEATVRLEELREDAVEKLDELKQEFKKIF